MFAPPSASTAAPIVGLHSFKAGKLNRVEGTNRVKPDPRKGLVYLEEVDDLLHLYWKDRTTGSVEEDLIIFPDEAEMVKVKESPSGRVFALKFSSSSQILFFWMQNKESDADENDVKRVNALIADPRAPAPSDAAVGRNIEGVSARELVGAGDLDLRAAAQTMGLSQDQLMRLLEPENQAVLRGDSTYQPRSTNPATTGAAGHDAPADTEMAASDDTTALHDLLAGIQIPQQRSEPVDLQDILTSDEVLPLLADADVRAALFPHLPPGLVSDPPTEDEVREIMSSVQWRQALSGLSYALNNGGDSAIRSLGIDSTNLEGSGVEAFIRAVSRHLREEQDGDAMEE